MFDNLECIKKLNCQLNDQLNNDKYLRSMLDPISELI